MPLLPEPTGTGAWGDSESSRELMDLKLVIHFFLTH